MGKPRKRRPPARRTQPEVSGRGTIRLGLVLLLLVGVNLYFFLWRRGTSIPDIQRASVSGQAVDPAAPGATAESESAPAPEADAGRWVNGKVAKDDSLGGILRREGLDPPEADELIRALQPQMDLRKIRAGQSYRLHFAADGALLGFEFEVSRVLLIKAARGADGVLTARKVEAPTETRVIDVGGAIDSSLYASIKRAGEEVSLVAFFVDVFAYDINFYIDTQPGDRFRMLVEKVFLDGKFLKYGRVLAAEYEGRVGTYRAFYWKGPGEARGRYYDDRGRSLEKTFLKTPLKYSRVSSGFNPRRMHPVLHRTKGHWGTDYAAPPGTPVWAAAGGKIVFRGPRGGAGNCVVLQHDTGLSTVYMHLSKFRQGQRVGQRVAQKTVIGYVGQTGLATGPHLHFGVKKNGQYVDAQKLKMEPGPPVPKQLRAQFEADTSALVGRLAAVAIAGAGPAAAEAAQSSVGPLQD